MDHKTSIPEVGQSVRVRNRLATVRAVEPYDSRSPQGRLHVVDLEYLDDFRYPETEQLLWEVEATAEPLGKTTLPSVDANRPDSPDALQAFVNAHRWTRLNRLRKHERIEDEPLLGVWNSAIQVHPYQLEPVIRALIGLAAFAFRALKEGKWSAETAADLSNEEVFEILGIPELTSAEAANVKGKTGTLILKRDGCHVWKPENFPQDNSRHGWTWGDFWNDAVALLGSEEAVREFIEGKPDKPEEEPEHTGHKYLFGHPIVAKPKQRKLF